MDAKTADGIIALSSFIALFLAMGIGSLTGWYVGAEPVGFGVGCLVFITVWLGSFFGFPYLLSKSK